MLRGVVDNRHYGRLTARSISGRLQLDALVRERLASPFPIDAFSMDSSRVVSPNGRYPPTVSRPPRSRWPEVVVGGSGKATFAGHVAEGGVLSDSATDTVFIVIVNHGTKVPGSIREAMLSPPFCGGGVCGPVIHAVHAP